MNFLSVISLVICVAAATCFVGCVEDESLPISAGSGTPVQFSMEGPCSDHHAPQDGPIEVNGGIHSRAVIVDLIDKDRMGNVTNESQGILQMPQGSEQCDEQRIRQAVDGAASLEVTYCQHCRADEARIPGFRCCQELLGPHEHPDEPWRIQVARRQR